MSIIFYRLSDYVIIIWGCSSCCCWRLETKEEGIRGTKRAEIVLISLLCFVPHTQANAKIKQKKFHMDICEHTYFRKYIENETLINS
jgi:hypothetical protein